MSINVFTFAGHLGRDAEIRQTKDDKSVTGFAVGVDVGYGDNKQTMWVDCSMWGDRGERLADYLVKGAQLTVTGEASLQTYTSNGVEKTKLCCRVNDVQLPPKSSTAAPRQQMAAQRAPEPRRDASFADAPGGGFDDDDIPFAPFRRHSHY